MPSARVVPWTHPSGRETGTSRARPMFILNLWPEISAAEAHARETSAGVAVVQTSAIQLQPVAVPG